MAELVAVLRFEQVEVVVEGIWSPFLLVKPPEQVFVVRIDSERVARCEQSNFFHSPDLSRVIAFGSSVSRSSEVSALNFSRNSCWTFFPSYPVHVRFETVVSVLNSASIGLVARTSLGRLPVPLLPSSGVRRCLHCRRYHYYQYSRRARGMLRRRSHLSDMIFG